ncbi:threonine synthase [Gemmatimonadetes bacterium T265]|nr:threonine synthase [Gemmatimonadetes bacterium T265]
MPASVPTSVPDATPVCARCGAAYGPLTLLAECPACGGLLDLHVPPPDVCGADLRARFDARRADRDAPVTFAADPGPARRSGVWRFRELILPGATDAECVSQPEGDTPLVYREPVARWAGHDALLLKHDGFNPTGSFKDRGMTVALTQARRAGARAVACASTGNTSAALAAYAALGGMAGLVLVPAPRAGAGGGAVPQVALGKLAQTLAYGARTLLVRGDFDRCLALLRAHAESLGVYLVNSVNPYRVAGQQSVAFEVAQQLGWSAPDWVVLPAGNLGNTSAVGAALRTMRALGLLARTPRVAAVQAAGAAPFARAFREQFAARHAVEADTVATAIKIGDPASWERAERVVRETDGVVTDVSDADLLEAKAAVDASGLGCEPASAASVAGVRRLAREGVIRPGETVVAILTGHVLKDPGLLLDYHRAGSTAAGANPPVEVDATPDALARVVDAALARTPGGAGA